MLKTLMEKSLRFRAVNLNNVQSNAVERYRMTRVLQERTRSAKKALKAQVEEANEKRRRILNLQIHIYESLNTMITALDAVDAIISHYSDKYADGFFIDPEYRMADLEGSRRAMFDSLVQVDRDGNYRRNNDDGGFEFDINNLDFESIKNLKKDVLDLIKPIIDISEKEKEYEPLADRLKNEAEDLKNKIQPFLQHYATDNFAENIEVIDPVTGDRDFQTVQVQELYDMAENLENAARESLTTNTPASDKKSIKFFRDLDAYLKKNDRRISQGLEELRQKDTRDTTKANESVDDDLDYLSQLAETFPDGSIEKAELRTFVRTLRRSLRNEITNPRDARNSAAAKAESFIRPDLNSRISEVDDLLNFFNNARTALGDTVNVAGEDIDLVRMREFAETTRQTIEDILR